MPWGVDRLLLEHVVDDIDGQIETLKRYIVTVQLRIAYFHRVRDSLIDAV